jgi:LmbE family N-acetylglucosaminyl deacetylase
MRALHIHAHHDDFEFVAAGTFELWRRSLGDRFKGRIIVCTDGKSGHHDHSREETGEIRRREQEASALLGGVEYQQLADHEGQLFREGCITTDRLFLAALWKAIRDFEPDYIFCPPIPADPLAGVHPDHLAVAEGVRRIAYMINVPHAFTPEYPAAETKSRPCRMPVILNVLDDYMVGANAYDLAVDAESVFDHLVDMGWCHQSQIAEWLPWVDRHRLTVPKSKEDWASQLRRRSGRINREMGVTGPGALEFFRVTAWGIVPGVDQLLKDFPALLDPVGTEARVRRSLSRWMADQPD